MRAGDGERISSEEGIEDQRWGIEMCFWLMDIGGRIMERLGGLWPFGDTVPLQPVVPGIGVPGTGEEVNENLDTICEECDQWHQDLQDIYDLLDNPSRNDR
jgi:hypothetical protein